MSEKSLKLIFNIFGESLLSPCTVPIVFAPTYSTPLLLSPGKKDVTKYERFESSPLA